MTMKNTMMRSAALALGLAAFAGTAYAADAIVEAPPAPPAAPMEQPPVATWAGPYAGVAIGYGFAGSTDTTTPGGASNDVDSDGFVGNAFAGWQWQSNNFVYGIEGDVGYNGMDGDNAGTSVEHGIDGSLRARLGIAATDNILIYGTAGGAASRLEVSDAAGSDSAAAYGYTVGAGVDAKLTQNVFGRVEYRYTNYGSTDLNTGSGSQSVDDSGHKVLVGLGVKF